MGKGERKAYREAIRDRYRKASKGEKRLILDEFCKVCGYHRKHAIRLLRKPPRGKAPPRKVGRRPRYGDEEFFRILVDIWLATDQMCGKRLKAALPIWLPHYESFHGYLAKRVLRELEAISSATIDRILKKARFSHPKGLCGTKPGKLLRNQIPIRTNHWDVTKPGFVEADTLAHCGNSLQGDFVWSLTLTDIQTGWTASRATWNNGAAGVIEQVKDIEKALPFPLRGFDCDNGGEFINHHLVQHFANRKNKVFFTRSRPYKKNDNPHVEQKNWAHIRQLFGYDRFENPEIVPLMNDLYANEWSLYQNHFCPTFKLLKKTRINSKCRKQYEKTPQTPYQRVLASPHIFNKSKNHLHRSHQNLNPFQLKASIEAKLKTISKLVTVTPNVRQRI